MSTVVEGKDTVKFVDEDQVNQAAAAAAETESTPAESTENDQSAAFNPETGEINWDCPCLGGMAQGPCGEQFKAAFSCFVYSEAEPKGLDCVEKFKDMQDCFRRHPDVYGDEIDDDDEEEEETTKPIEEEAKEASTVVASSAYEGESSVTDSISSWVSSWF
ncbi:Mitochondrial intermembrane space import and assembly protein 40 [Choanephora cucurbitarum]|uniref:Mitochondrial intermembrane space import and assembly protein 40 n=1 Tax=Choanephora cucurbitarum TaxID=101091 RepID=A0A1C7NNM8_9FUNG|nr:Mitochondrial intermembrane space import and assembly protein 40 [Choanephora cucurbitarum]